ncbi:MAG: hypothetical protein GY820_28685 [Gammaproteobacteria bacterium]|nr:hypothetical protein [Gammaproteobacteria bacterium]
MQSVGQSKPRVTDGRVSTDDGKELMFTQLEPATYIEEKARYAPSKSTPDSNVQLNEPALKERRPSDRRIHKDMTFLMIACLIFLYTAPLLEVARLGNFSLILET